MTGFDEAAWRGELHELLRRHQDAHLYDVVWSCLEGRISRRELRRDPAYRAAIGEFYRDRFAELAGAGVDFAEIGREARRRVEADDAAQDGGSWGAGPQGTPPRVG